MAKLFGSARFLGLLFLGAAATMATSPLASAQQLEWRYFGTADWAGRDRLWSSGPIPSARQCNSTWYNTVAVCWSNRLNPDGQMGAWCVYKTVSPDATPNGGAPGAAYVCR